MPKMLLPQVLTGFRINKSTARRNRFPPKPHPQCFAPSTGGIQNLSTAWGNRFAPSTGGSWTHRKSVLLKYCQNYERSRGTTDLGMQGCGVAVSGVRGCAARARKEIQCLPRGASLEDRTKRGLLLWETMRGAGLPRTESWKIGFQDQACRNALSNFPALTVGN